MADEPAGPRAGEHDGMDAGVAVDAVDQVVEFVSRLEAEQAVWSTVDARDQGGSAVLDLEVAVVWKCHGFRFPWVHVMPRQLANTSVEGEDDLPGLDSAGFDVGDRFKRLLEREG